ncbi:serine/threonine protein kinase [Miniimonas arenae]|uniref:non-specific serine/threonine protein kinase n=1 Tax=Miniimonas arenae TaxID=676201 RepID=A0A5C5BFY0_9MICO|nr:serine/threonine-protein kinase [Miniimonas arenae]TNU76273.1 serine/threonine protein kinase [Miniimonas arenae]
MTARTSGPPAIDGYTPMALVGHGGHADVYTYQQRSPRRVVAVKVLAAPEGGADTEALSAALEAEADYLAELSRHPSIVTVHSAGVSADGRPYIVMEYCARPGLGSVYRRQRLGVPEVLRIGIRLASAVETAHRAGVLHRDIKPANVLVTDFGWPALADFGIAGAVGAGSAAGVSVPWAAPEVLVRGTADERSDIYSLGATLYALLAQRSPFEVPGADNDPYELMARIERGNPPPVGRPDVPQSLESVLHRALGPAAARYRSAADLGRALQQVELELSLPVTELDLPEVPQRGAAWVDQTGTSINPGEAARQAGPLQPWDPTRVRPIEIADVPEADPRGGHGDGRGAGEGRSARVMLAVVLVLVGTVAAVWLLSRLGSRADPTPTAQATSTLALGTTAPTPTDLTATRVPGGVEVTWVNPSPRTGDTYAWSLSGPGTTGERTIVTEPRALVPAEASAPVCVDVVIVRADGAASMNPGNVCVQD